MIQFSVLYSGGGYADKTSEMNTKYFTIIHGFSLSIHLFSLTSCVCFTRPPLPLPLLTRNEALSRLLAKTGWLTDWLTLLVNLYPQSSPQRTDRESWWHPHDEYIPSIIIRRGGGRVTLCPRVYGRLSAAAGHYYAHRVVGRKALTHGRIFLHIDLTHCRCCHKKEGSSITGSSSEIRNERMCTVYLWPPLSSSCHFVLWHTVIRI